MIQQNLICYQYTARDVKTGAMFLGYGDSVSETYSCLFIRKLLIHLRSNGIELEGVTIQTDNATEFSGNRIYHDRGFVFTVEEFKAKHKYIPPRMSNVNSDV